LLGPLDLRVLPLGARLPALVIGGEKEDYLRAVRVAEDPQQDVAVRSSQVRGDSSVKTSRV
jgi:hypothetical protein